MARALLLGSRGRRFESSLPDQTQIIKGLGVKAKKVISIARQSGVKASKNIVKSGVGAVVGGAILGPFGIVFGATASSLVGDVLDRVLSDKQKSKLDKVLQLASVRIQDNLKKCAPIKHGDELDELLEGTLLSARDTYEEKKVDLLANLLATAPFTNTPVQNLLDTLKHAESLTYRQLCILAVLDKDQFDRKLSKSKFRDSFNGFISEEIEGVLFDVHHLLNIGLIGLMDGERSNLKSFYVQGDIIPRNITMFYTARLLVNGLQLASIPQEDQEPIREILSKTTTG